MKIAIGGDHASIEYKPKLVAFLESEGHKVKDFGPFSDDAVDYPDFAHPVSTAVHTLEYDFGILICGSGQGVSMTANKHDGIRAALCWKEEIASLSRQHNNANIVCLPARFITYEEAKGIVKTFLATEFEGGRHQRRVSKITC
ncbi:MAG: ribose 5-phosphate isomerase B [Cyclobacteriaceae bacterium]|nr:ribose 5-phosphate isomerase B [Cyclobacteriaceae bacterium]